MIRRWISLVLACLPAAAQPVLQPTAADFFESKIRPVLAAKCYGCHSSALAAPVEGLMLDTKAGLARVVTAGKPEQSRILQAIRYTDPNFQMPPSGKLPDGVIADFEQWIAAGAVDPRV